MKTSIARLGLVSALLLAGCGAQPSLTAGAPNAAGAMAARAIANPNALQKHLMFFDTNNDGKLTVDETKAGLERLGLNPAGALAGAVFIHAGLQKAGGGGLSLDLSKITMAKHKSDTGAFDANGKFVPAAFERMFTFDTNHSNSLSWTELKAMMAANKQDTAGAIGSKAEFGLLIKLGADTTEMENGQKVPAVSRKRLQSIYTGTLFYDIAAEREKSHAKPVDDKLPE
jgi:peroxygenase